MSGLFLRLAVAIAVVAAAAVHTARHPALLQDPLFVALGVAGAMAIGVALFSVGRGPRRRRLTHATDRGATRLAIGAAALGAGLAAHHNDAFAPLIDQFAAAPRSAALAPIVTDAAAEPDFIQSARAAPSYEPQPLVHTTAAYGEVRDSVLVRRGRSGHFTATVVIGGQELDMLVDTGSSDVALPYNEAARLGVDLRALVFDHPVMTANGQAMVAPIDLDVVSIGPITLRGVAASVAEPGRLGSPLLGMSFLGRLSEVTLRGETMELVR